MYVDRNTLVKYCWTWQGEEYYRREEKEMAIVGRGKEALIRKKAMGDGEK